MKTPHFLLAGMVATCLLAGCSAPTGEGSTTGVTPAPASSAEARGMVDKKATHAAAAGTIEAIDPAARTITIAHGPVPAMGWPAMTMTFQTRDVDLTGFKVGDRIAFEFSASGMTAMLTVLRHE